MYTIATCTPFGIEFARTLDESYSSATAELIEGVTPGELFPLQLPDLSETFCGKGDGPAVPTELFPIDAGTFQFPEFLSPPRVRKPDRKRKRASTPDSLERRRARRNGSATAREHCNCKNTRCLKLYCVCYAAGRACVASCTCKDCANDVDSEPRTGLGYCNCRSRSCATNYCVCRVAGRKCTDKCRCCDGCTNC